MTKNDGGEVTIYVSGHIDYSTSPDLRKALSEIVVAAVTVRDGFTFDEDAAKKAGGIDSHGDPEIARRGRRPSKRLSRLFGRPLFALMPLGRAAKRSARRNREPPAMRVRDESYTKNKISPPNMIQ